MLVKNEAIDVRVSNRILWVGAEAYPLRNISRVSTMKWEARRGVVIWNYVKSVARWVVLGVVAGTVLSMISNSGVPAILAAIVVLGLIVVKTMRLMTLLKLTLYELIIETSGASTRALASDDPNVVSDLVYRITDAINNPKAEFVQRVNNIHVGDNVHVSGHQNVGKVAG